MLWAQDMLQDTDAGNHVTGTLGHQGLVTGDPGFALRAVDQQQLYVMAVIEFHLGGKTCTTQPDDTGATDVFNQLDRVGVAVIDRRQHRGCRLLSIGIDHDTGRGQPRRVWDRSGLDGNNRSRGGRMHRCTDLSDRLGQYLAGMHIVTHLHPALGRFPDVLLQWQYQLRRNAGEADWLLQ